MAYSFSAGGSSSIKATELVVSMFDQVDSAFYDALYPEILWRDFVPQKSVMTDINPGAINYVYRTRDIKGIGQFVRGSSNNIPRVGQVIGQVTVPILDAAVGATVTDGDARRYAYGHQSALAQDLGEVMKKAADYHIERTVFFGNTVVGFASFLDYPTVPKITPVAAWDSTDPDSMVSAIQDWITYVWRQSKTVHLPDEVILPPEKFSMLLRGYVVGSTSGGDKGTGVAVSALEYARKNNLYTAMTGKDLTIRALRYLEGAGSGAVDRAIIRETNPRNQVLPFPLAYQLAQPVPIALGVDIFAEYVFGSYHMRFPYSCAYADGL